MGFKLAPEGLKMRDIDPWQELYEARDTGAPVQARITRTRYINGQGDTWEVEFASIHAEGITGLIPSSQTGLPEGSPMENFVGQTISCKIMKIDRENNMIACSRKEAVDEAAARLFRELRQGEKISALVRAVTARSVYVDAGAGLIVRISGEKARLSAGVPLEVQYPKNSIIPVKVLEVDRENKRLSLEPVDPWEDWEFKRGEIISGRIAAVRDNVAYVVVKKGVVGRTYYNRRDSYKEGDSVEFQVKDFDREKRHLHLESYNPKKIARRRLQRAKRATGKEGAGNGNTKK
ncbi:MAG: RNA-binding protein [Firmicutes bacterium]|nr:RNA-binding protein [Bacillota bacterium]